MPRGVAARPCERTIVGRALGDEEEEPAAPVPANHERLSTYSMNQGVGTAGAGSVSSRQPGPRTVTH
jgi:hypothetical protein